MAATAPPPRAGTLARLAHWLGRMCARTERKAAGALLSVGMSQKAARAVLWAVKLAIFVGFLFVAFWLAALFLFAITGAWIIRNGAREKEQTEAEWRYGAFGFGLYHPDGSRIDPHDPNRINDTV